MTLYSIQNAIKKRLAAVSGDEADYEARLILSHALGLDMLELILERNRELYDCELEHIERLTSRRETGYPLQYILGRWDFFGLEFVVDERALIPRQDTETLVEAALDIASNINAETALDMCCGSGCIGIALGVYGGLSVTFSDISNLCLSLTEENALKNSVTPGGLILSDMFQNIEGTYDIITINPPYLTRSDMEHIQRELEFEPSLALFGGDDGLDFYRRISRDYREHLNSGGALIMEIGASQFRDVHDIFGKAELIRDISDNPRVVVVYRD